GLDAISVDLVVVADQYAYGLFHDYKPSVPTSGRSTSIRVPFLRPLALAGQDSRWNLPPSPSILSRMAVRPKLVCDFSVVASKPMPSSSMMTMRTEPLVVPRTILTVEARECFRTFDSAP